VRAMADSRIPRWGTTKMIASPAISGNQFLSSGPRVSSAIEKD
jgi:hypothetical protein